MNTFKKIFLWMALTLCVVSSQAPGEEKILSMSTTTSTQASGLLDILLPAFEKDTGIKVKVMAKGTGAAIRDGMDGNVDVIFVHAKEKEEVFIKEGYGTKRYAVMHNDFIIVGPPTDPAGIKDSNNASESLLKIAQTKSFFISRGDDSGTHIKEQELWEKSGVPLKKTQNTIAETGSRPAQPEGKWYLSIGQGMGKTIMFADEKQAYTLSDRGTYIKYKYESNQGIGLDIMCEGDLLLNNLYGIIPVNPERFPHVRYDLAKQFSEWLISEKGQSLIENYKVLGYQLFYPDALK